MSRHIRQFVTTPRILTLVAGALLTCALAATVHVSAGARMQLTVHKEVALPGVVLTPGEYIFETLDAAGGHAVRVASRNGRAVFLGLTVPTERTRRAAAGGELVLGEAPAGEPQPIRAWFPDGSLHGEAFLYR